MVEYRKGGVPMEHAKKDRKAKPSEDNNTDTTTIKRKVGRPRKELDVNQIKTLAEIGCTCSEIAAVMSCSENTLRANYCDIIKSGVESGNASLKHLQFKAAKAGSVAMLIWLGKQRLGQRDVVETVADKDAIKAFRMALREQDKSERGEK
jgi:hypothetical protein